MKIYRQSIWKANSTRTRFIPLVISFLIVLLLIHQKLTFLLWAGGFILIFALMMCTTYFYVIITNNSIIIKNSVFPFWKEEFGFSYVQKVEIGHTGGFTPDYLRVYTSSKKSRRYVIDLVSEKDYPNLINDLKNKGISAEKGITSRN